MGDISHEHDRCLIIEPMTSYSAEVIAIDIAGSTFWVSAVGFSVLQSNNVVAEALAVSLDKPVVSSVEFFFGNTELNLELWTVILGTSGFDD